MVDRWLDMSEAISLVLVRTALPQGAAERLICNACASGMVRWRNRPVRSTHFPPGPVGPAEWKDAVIELGHGLVRCGGQHYLLPSICRDELDWWLESGSPQAQEETRRRYDWGLHALNRISLTQAIKEARTAGKPDPWRWLRAQIRSGDLKAWGTIGADRDNPLIPEWLANEAVFQGEDGQQKPPTDDCLWFSRGDRPHRISDVAVDAATLASLLAKAADLRADKWPVSKPEIDNLRQMYRDRVAEFETKGSVPPLQTTKDGTIGDREWAAKNRVSRTQITAWRAELLPIRKRGRRTNSARNSSGK